ncbi:MAG: HAMP domain-containing histidine kinase [Aureispira sp.]|nr:HAMP domain-containing histidine kinase [Aureispira sp.]
MRRLKFYEKTRWRLLLILGGLSVLLASIYYTNAISQKLKISEEKDVELWAEAQKLMISASPDDDLTLHSLVTDPNNIGLPIIITDAELNIIDAMNYGKKSFMEDPAFFEGELLFLKENSSPIIIENEEIQYKAYIFYRTSPLLVYLEWFPYVQFGILAIFLLLAYLTFSSSRQAEQERVWVGMSKETAHQLGTPLTSLIGWIENMRMMYPDNDEIDMMAVEMTKDIDMLQIVAERFSKIGTVPDLKPINIYDNLDKHLKYIKQRASRKISFDFPYKDEFDPVDVYVNPLLFDWVIENLLKNALDAMGGKGEIAACVSESKDYVNIDIKDTGKGMPKSHFKSVFQPGFSTKERGWGLGLSLCKRIVEKYHNGKIFVKSSTIGQGTTFRIQLPKTLN